MPKIINNITEQELYDLYINKCNTALECSKYFKCSEGCIIKRLERYGIKQRTKSESKLGELNPMYGKYNKLAIINSHTTESIKKRNNTIQKKYLSGELIPPNKNKKFSKSHIDNLSKSHLGQVAWNKNKTGFISNKKGKSHKEIYGEDKAKEINEMIKKARAKQIFPLKDTKIEIKIRNFLDTLQIEYFQHKYISEISHSYQCDFFIPSKNLVIECDGDYWHKYPVGKDIDKIRTSELIKRGFNVLRLWESEIKVMDLNRFNTILKLD